MATGARHRGNNVCSRRLSSGFFFFSFWPYALRLLLTAALCILWFLFVFYSYTYLHCLIDPESDRILGVQVEDAELYK
jgi:hypothetical protein